MTAEQQLERSVLEGKERDELHAIAQALSVKTTTRTKKADIIDGILKATGVAVDDGATKNGDSRAGAGTSNGAGTDSAETLTAARTPSRRPRGTARSDADGDVTSVSDATSEIGAERDGTSSIATRQSAAENGSGDETSPTGRNGNRSRAQARSSAGATFEDGGGAHADDADPAENGSRARADAAGVRQTEDGEAGDAGADQDGPDASGSDQSRREAQGDRGDRQGGQGGQGYSPGGQGGQGNRQNNQSNRQGGQGNNQGGQGNQGNRQNNQNNQGGQGNRQGGADSELGNRRSNRRRRGRDRQGGGERELQGAGAGQEQQYQGELIPVRGLLDLRDEGYGFLRCDGYLPSNKDVYVSISQARRFALRRGDYVEGACRPAGNTEKFPALLRIDTVSGLDPEAARDRPRFEDLTPLFPDSRLNLEMPGEKENMTTRIVDLLSPIGKGQRGLIVSPPKAGKTTVMKHIAHSIEANNPDVHLMVLLVDERPEEVTDMRRSVKGEVVASTFDRPADEHTAVSELAIERAKRLVEMGRDVVIILDGITRLARAYNLAAPATGRIMSGGVDSGALYPPKKFFGAARNIEEGGSLTILATALVETGSKMDEVIFEEFKGTGNMELRLDRRLSERRLYPSIDVNASSTRHEELLFDRSQLQQVWKLRRVLNALANEGSAAAGLELLMDKIRTTKSNDEFLAEIAKGPAAPN
jgi:transcription termination factor Rho